MIRAAIRAACWNASMHDPSKQSVARSFDQVDSLRDSDALINYLDAQSNSRFWRQLKLDSLSALALTFGHFALDVGCGLGGEVRAMAAIVGPRGRAIGIDFSEKFLYEARARTDSNCLAEFLVGDAHQMPFDDDTFDALRVERTLQHTACPLVVAAEMFRVAKPGAKMIAIEPDWDTLVIAATHLAISRTICRRWADRVRHPTIGREASAMFRQAGFQDVVVHPCTSLIYSLAFAEQQFEFKQMMRAAVAENQIDQAAASQWLQDIQARDDIGCFLVAVTYFVVRGRRPC